MKCASWCGVRWRSLFSIGPHAGHRQVRRELRADGRAEHVRKFRSSAGTLPVECLEVPTSARNERCPEPDPHLPSEIATGGQARSVADLGIIVRAEVHDGKPTPFDQIEKEQIHGHRSYGRSIAWDIPAALQRIGQQLSVAAARHLPISMTGQGCFDGIGRHQRGKPVYRRAAPFGPDVGGRPRALPATAQYGGRQQDFRLSSHRHPISRRRPYIFQCHTDIGATIAGASERHRIRNRDRSTRSSYNDPIAVRSIA